MRYLVFMEFPLRLTAAVDGEDPQFVLVCDTHDENRIKAIPVEAYNELVEKGEVAQ
jgi:hypothetical protein